MSVTAEVLDPRFDPRPEYWTALRERAGLRADWSWEVLNRQAWCARTYQPVTVLKDGGDVRGVVCAAWVTGGVRRNRFARAGSGLGLLGGLDVRAPGTSATPGWWFADAGPDGGVRELLDGYARAMRAELGTRFRVMLLRQVGQEGVATVSGRLRLVRRTEDVAVLDLTRFATRAEWAASLPKARRTSLRKIGRDVDADTALAIDVVPGRDADVPAVAELLRHNEVKHRDVPIVPLPQFTGYLTALLAEPDVVVIRYTDTGSGRLLAVAIVLDDPVRPIMRHWSAVPVEAGGRPNLYFHCYGECVRWALEVGRPALVLGKKMSKVKKSLGAELVPQYAAVIPVW
ncbi:GNAT family N-acetyltransferase [Amycolatopsis sp. H20-H5]|uniref:GNAT family N-acetyltransferase n=1 Tax=Amycolatopsis sp. H20-H5 TaxID=3046309 RepID=UPI002DBF19AA|nr:GNAT family N-acetyltransferase [Amycolatopsis sp. H20-H5]MEC3977239.1 GNAT family N-acetyltransferase [Amycolatopsis sp. H20-H5]